MEVVFAAGRRGPRIFTSQPHRRLSGDCSRVRRLRLVKLAHLATASGILPKLLTIQKSETATLTKPTHNANNGWQPYENR